MDGTITKNHFSSILSTKSSANPPLKSQAQENTPKQDKDLLQASRTTSEVSISKPSASTASRGPNLQRPTNGTLRAAEGKDLPNFTSKFFDGKYKSPDSTKTLTSLRDRSFSVGLPFLFAVKESIDSHHGQHLEAFPCATFYERVDAEETRSIEGKTKIYIVKRDSVDISLLGTIDDLERNETPLGFHLLLLNNEEFSISDPENLQGETLAACSILFRVGTCVQTDQKLADDLMSMIPKQDRGFHFGRAMIDALMEEDYRCAEACLAFGGEVKSVDDHGHVAISCALRPGAEQFLDQMLSRNGTGADVFLLREELSTGQEELSEPIKSILKRHIDRLSINQSV